MDYISTHGSESEAQDSCDKWAKKFPHKTWFVTPTKGLEGRYDVMNKRKPN